MTRFYLNHIGLELGAQAKALLDVSDGDSSPVTLLTSAGWTSVMELQPGPPMLGFRGRHLAPLDLSQAPRGRYVLRQGTHESSPFRIDAGLLTETTTDAVLSYFRALRSVDPWDAKDRAVPFFGSRQGTVDVHGGWFDASGDVSKYLSHLSYANFMNPQQTPLVVWSLGEHLARRTAVDGGVLPAGLRERLIDEMRHGADFLVRMQDPEGYFYMTVFDQWSKYTERRVICAYRTQKGELEAGYQAGYRQGGGLAIAALAMVARVTGEARYLKAAEHGFAHLEQAGTAYLDDGKENIIDDYCALLAAVELQLARPSAEYLKAATRRGNALLDRIRLDGPHPGWFRADDGDRPFYHASDAGLPVVALLKWAELEGAPVAKILEATERALSFELWVTNEQPNPFGYARQYTVDSKGERRLSYFIPHQNETGYWWQGENARLASLATAALWLAGRSQNASFVTRLRSYAQDQLDWICGRNPFDTCMLHGFGHNNRHYMERWPNVIGGIQNGITSRFEDETDVDFGRDDIEGDHSWRWYEQWLPHASWFFLALALARAQEPEQRPPTIT